MELTLIYYSGLACHISVWEELSLNKQDKSD